MTVAQARESGETRWRILRAAEALAREAGPGHLSLDAVAARAGVSKGGLLYHFASKAKLMEALVADFLGEIDETLRAEESTGRPDAVIDAYISEFEARRCAEACPPSGLLAALAEDPDLLDPVRGFERDFLARIRANATDPDLATIAFLALHGIRSMELLNVSVLGAEEAARLVAELRGRLGLPPSRTEPLTAG
jgi:AcrR family transcriptional regulator